MSDSTDDRPVDILSITPSGYNRALIECDLFRGVLDAYRGDIEAGIEIHQDGPDIGLSAGTTYSETEQPSLYSYHGLTPEQAREIASALEEAAEKAEAAEQPPDRTEPGKSLIRRLLP
ncbi:hypothetical protein [Haloarchaeobius sp. DFWS5]|uniref:hypothetical protein n=1 Tax=Haloarchaeobius sp. DFWS5 TaxID=3446114 RepID=UPI003EBB8006